MALAPACSMSFAYSGRRAVERGDDGQRDGLLHEADLFQVLVGAEAEFGGLREVGERFRVPMVEELHVVHHALLLARDLLFEQRVHRDGGRPGVLEPLDEVEVVHHGRRARHHRVRQGQSQIGRRQIHCGSPSPGAAGWRRAGWSCGSG